MIVEFVKKIVRGEDLSAEEATRAMTEIMTGKAGEIRTASLLTALSMKGETAQEIESFARAMRKAAIQWTDPRTVDLCDTCGTGGDSLNTINVSTMTALLLASMGLSVAKHGNRAISSSTGSADLLEEVGVNLDMDPAELVECLNKVGICFLYAPRWHPAMKYAGPVRKAMGIRTVFNLLGPLTNPAPIAYQVVGVFARQFLEPMGHALAGLGRKGAYVVHSEEGLDEVSISSATNYIQIEQGRVTGQGQFTPEDFGFSTHPLSTIQVNVREESVTRSRSILAGRGSDAENAIISMNAALIYSMVHREKDLKKAAEICHTALLSGKAEKTMEEWARFGSGSRSTISMGRLQ